MINYQKGRRYEYKAVNLLRTRGYDCTRTAGSHGHYDVIAVSGKEVLLVQVKSGADISKKELEEFREMKVPYCCRKEVWTWKKGWKTKEV